MRKWRKLLINNNSKEKNMNIEIVPQHDRVLVKLDTSYKPEKSPGGIYLPDSAKESPIVIGTVMSVASGSYKDGVFIVPDFMPGDKVMFGQFAGANIDEPMGFENFMLVRDADILAVIREVEYQGDNCPTEEPIETTEPGSDYGVKPVHKDDDSPII